MQTAVEAAETHHTYQPFQVNKEGDKVVFWFKNGVLSGVHHVHFGDRIQMNYCATSAYGVWVCSHCYLRVVLPPLDRGVMCLPQTYTVERVHSVFAEFNHLEYKITPTLQQSPAPSTLS